MVKETWKAIPGQKGRYEVSDKGRVRSLPRKVKQTSRWGTEFVRLLPGQLLKPGRTSSGHMTVAIGKGNSACVHILVLLAFVGRPRKGQEVRHLDGNPANNKLSNLCYGTRSENLRDVFFHGGRRVTPTQVKSLRKRHARGESALTLAVEFEYSLTGMRDILSGKSYGGFDARPS